MDSNDKIYLMVSILNFNPNCDKIKFFKSKEEALKYIKDDVIKEFEESIEDGDYIPVVTGFDKDDIRFHFIDPEIAAHCKDSLSDYDWDAIQYRIFEINVSDIIKLLY